MARMISLFFILYVFMFIALAIFLIALKFIFFLPIPMVEGDDDLYFLDFLLSYAGSI